MVASMACNLSTNANTDLVQEGIFLVTGGQKRRVLCRRSEEHRRMHRALCIINIDWKCFPYG